MYLWRRPANRQWLSIHENDLRAAVGNGLAMIERPDRKRSQLEVACRSQILARKLVNEFGGRLEVLPRDWLKRFSRETNTKRLKIGTRLIVVRTAKGADGDEFPCRLVLPAGAAFGTGEHPTTAMSLKLLEQVTRKWNPGWSMVDLGTGSGILAVAAKCFGAKRVSAIDVDPVAISTAKSNARRNRINGIQFQVGEAGRWHPPAKTDLVTANLFSELLIEILPKLRGYLSTSGWVILSGALRSQEREILAALGRNNLAITEIRRRGRWIAFLAR
jgi:ribosomal protein L11 methyltransferase